jgi:hypothetical protein
MLTLVKHVAFVERRWWFNGIAGRGIDGLWPPADPHEEHRIDDDDTIESVRALYGEIIDECRTIGRAVEDLDIVDDAGLNNRWILLHLIEEVARHAGHADIIREAIDGATGV